MSDLDDAIDALYALPLDEFTGTRNSLSKKLKDAGDKEAAAKVKGLQKPSVSAWTINQLVRQRGDDVRELLDVQAELADAGSAKRVRELSERRREVVARLVKDAEDVLEAAGHGAGSETLQKISRTLLAATPGDNADLVRAGRLARDLSSSGFDQVFGSDPAEDDDDSDAVDERARRKAQELAAEADAVEQQAVELERAAEELRAQTEEAEDAAAAARRRADKARAKADAAWEKLS